MYWGGVQQYIDTYQSMSMSLDYLHKTQSVMCLDDMQLSTKHIKELFLCIGMIKTVNGV